MLEIQHLTGSKHEAFHFAMIERSAVHRPIPQRTAALPFSNRMRPRMPRNAEVIRQWRLLLHLDERAHGSSVDDLARELGVTKRTVWRDLVRAFSVREIIAFEMCEAVRAHF